MRRKIWVVIYQTATNEVYGWFCKAENPDEAEQQFRQAVTIPCTIKNVSECQSSTIENYFFLYGAGEHQAPASESRAN